MDKGIFTATSGGLLESRRLQNASNNVANTNTVGFKTQKLASRQQEFKDTLVGATKPGDVIAAANAERTPGVVSTATVVDFSPGAVSYTGNALHVALADSETFFVVQTPQGEEYTRAGNFGLNRAGQLVTSDGLPVMGTSGPIEVGEGIPKIMGNGAVLSNDQEVAKIRTVQITDLKSLEHRGGTRFGFGAGGGAANELPPRLIEQSVELPNNTVLESMVDMITIQRSFEAYTKVVRSIDEINERVIRLARAAG